MSDGGDDGSGSDSGEAPHRSSTTDGRAVTHDDQFRALVDAVEEYAIFRLDPDGTIASWNPGAERLKGYTQEEILGEHLSTFYTEEACAAGVPEANLAAATEGGSVEDEGWRVRDDGSRFWANVTITAIRGPDGELEGFAKVTRDMTDRRRAAEERQLHLSVGRSVAEATSLEEGLQAAVEDVCAYTEWVVGQAWIPTDDGVVERLPVSHVQEPVFEQFERASHEYTFGPGEGIPGRVLGSGEPVWFPDVTEVPERVYPRTALAADAGLQAGLGVPVIADGEVAIVLEFYMAERRDEDEHLVDLVASVAADLGTLVTRKQVQDELNRERELLAEVMDAAPVGISVLTAEGEIERMNARARELHGGPEREGSPRTPETREFFDEDGDPVPHDERPFARVVETEAPVHDWLGQIELPDGHRKWLSVDAAPIVDDDGVLDCVVIVEEDITELREQYRAITEAINDVIVTIDTTSVIRSINPAVQNVFGYTRDELIGESLTTLMPAGYPEEHHAAVERYLETGERRLDWDYVELPGQHADGSEIPLALSFSEIEYRGDRYFTGVLRDISRRRTYQRRLEESNERLEQFAYAASHDLQEPLRMVTSYLQLLERRYGDELDADAEEFIEFAVDGAERMREMIDSLLEYSRVDTRGDPFEAVDLDAVLAEACQDLQVKIEETDAEIVAGDLPTVSGDRSQLTQVFQNLLSNAIEYSGDSPPEVHVSAEPAGDEWIVSGRDHGIGIDPDDQDQIFDVFQRLHTQDEHSGTGIGLSLCRRIVERHGGEIWVESELGKGATFSFSLPRDASEG